MGYLNIADRLLARLNRVQKVTHVCEMLVVRIRLFHRLHSINLFVVAPSSSLRKYLESFAINKERSISSMKGDAVAFIEDSAAVALAVLICANPSRIFVSSDQGIRGLAIILQVELSSARGDSLRIVCSHRPLNYV